MVVENVGEIRVSKGVCVSKGCVYVSKGVSSYQNPIYNEDYSSRHLSRRNQGGNIPPLI